MNVRDRLLADLVAHGIRPSVIQHLKVSDVCMEDGGDAEYLEARPMLTLPGRKAVPMDDVLRNALEDYLNASPLLGPTLPREEGTAGGNRTPLLRLPAEHWAPPVSQHQARRKPESSHAAAHDTSPG